MKTEITRYKLYRIDTYYSIADVEVTESTKAALQGIVNALYELVRINPNYELHHYVNGKMFSTTVGYYTQYHILSPNQEKNNEN